MMQRILIKLVKAYQKIPGSWHASCKFYPTCSNFAIESLEKYGALKGVILTIFRICRCNPWCKGGYYPVPDKFSVKAREINVE